MVDSTIRTKDNRVLEASDLDISPVTDNVSKAILHFHRGTFIREDADVCAFPRQWGSSALIEFFLRLDLDGQGAGQYGQGMSQYGQGMGQYGQGIGQYGQGGSQYGQGMGQYGQGMGQYGQGMGQYGQGGSYYNQNSGYGSGSYNNRPGYSSNYNPSGGSYGNYGWNGSEKQNINVFTILFASLIALSICFLTMWALSETKKKYKISRVFCFDYSPLEWSYVCVVFCTDHHSCVCVRNYSTLGVYFRILHLSMKQFLILKYFVQTRSMCVVSVLFN